MNKDVTLVVRFYSDNKVLTNFVDAFFDVEKARQKAKELEKQDQLKNVKGVYYGVITYPIVDAN